VTFSDVDASAAEKTVTIGGLTLTIAAGTVATSTEDDTIAALFANLSDGATAGASTPTWATWSGKLTGFSSGAVSGTNNEIVVFTSTTDKTNVTDLSTAGVTSSTPTQGKAANKIDTISIHNAGGAAAAITALDAAITGVTAEQAKYGAYLSRLQYASDNIGNVATNLDQSRSRIQDADYAIETTALARTQIIAQASTAMLAQANQVKQTVLALLQ
jgi:flagellin